MRHTHLTIHHKTAAGENPKKKTYVKLSLLDLKCTAKVKRLVLQAKINVGSLVKVKKKNRTLWPARSWAVCHFIIQCNWVIINSLLTISSVSPDSQIKTHQNHAPGSRLKNRQGLVPANSNLPAYGTMHSPSDRVWKNTLTVWGLFRKKTRNGISIQNVSHCLRQGENVFSWKVPEQRLLWSS